MPKIHRSVKTSILLCRKQIGISGRANGDDVADPQLYRPGFEHGESEGREDEAAGHVPSAGDGHEGFRGEGSPGDDLLPDYLEPPAGDHQASRALPALQLIDDVGWLRVV